MLSTWSKAVVVSELVRLINDRGGTELFSYRIDYWFTLMGVFFLGLGFFSINKLF